MTEEVLARYEQAQHLIQGGLEKNLVLNDCVFPHWVESGHCFWYKRETHEGGNSGGTRRRWG